jgi:hypothetical protein
VPVQVECKELVEGAALMLAPVAIPVPPAPPYDEKTIGLFTNELYESIRKANSQMKDFLDVYQ